MCFNKGMWSCRCHHSRNTENLYHSTTFFHLLAVKSLSFLPLDPMASLMSVVFLYCTLSSMSNRWNHLICRFFLLTSFTLHIFWDLPVVLHVSIVGFFLLLSSTPSYECMITCLFTNKVMAILLCLFLTVINKIVIWRWSLWRYIFHFS